MAILDLFQREQKVRYGSIICHDWRSGHSVAGNGANVKRFFREPEHKFLASRFEMGYNPIQGDIRTCGLSPFLFFCWTLEKEGRVWVFFLVLTEMSNEFEVGRV